MSQKFHIELATFFLFLMFFYHVVAIIGYSPPVIHAQLAVDQSNLHDYLPDKLPDGFDVVKTRSSLKKHQEFRSNKDVTFPRCYIAVNTLLTVYLFIILMYKSQTEKSPLLN